VNATGWRTGLPCWGRFKAIHGTLELRHPCLRTPLQDKPVLHPLFNRSYLARVVQNQRQHQRWERSKNNPFNPPSKEGGSKSKLPISGHDSKALALALDFAVGQHV